MEYIIIENMLKYFNLEFSYNIYIVFILYTIVYNNFGS